MKLGEVAIPHYFYISICYFNLVENNTWKVIAKETDSNIVTNPISHIIGLTVDADGDVGIRNTSILADVLKW